MIAATAYDECELARRRERLFNGGREPLTAAERASVARELAAERAMGEWLATGVLDGRIEPRDGSFVVIRHNGRVAEYAPTLRAAERVAVESWGIRRLDVTACGRFAGFSDAP